MALEASFRELFSELRKVNDTMVALRLTVVEDKPVRGDSALIDQLEDTILELMGLLNEALKAARSAHKAVEQTKDLDGARRALTVCQERFHRIERQFSSDLNSYERLKDLATLASERRGEWVPWSTSARQGIEECRFPMDGASKALSACWLEIAERVGMTSISVRTTNIGQKVAGPVAEEAVP